MYTVHLHFCKQYLIIVGDRGSLPTINTLGRDFGGSGGYCEFVSVLTEVQVSCDLKLSL